jgi:hypothetical protein
MAQHGGIDLRLGRKLRSVQSIEPGQKRLGLAGARQLRLGRHRGETGPARGTAVCLDNPSRLLDPVFVICFGQRREPRIGALVLRRQRGGEGSGDEDRRSENGSPHRHPPFAADQSGFFATPTMAGRSKRSLIM